MLRRLAVFDGGFTLEAAQQVAEDEDGIDRWDVLEHLGALVDKSLVVAEGAAVPRYRLLAVSLALTLFAPALPLDILAQIVQFDGRRIVDVGTGARVDIGDRLAGVAAAIGDTAGQRRPARRGRPGRRGWSPRAVRFGRPPTRR